MIYSKILLSEITKEKVGSDAFVEIFLNEKIKDLNIEPRPAAVILPGGAYEYCSQREGEPIALRYMSEGFNCFVLHYTCKAPYPLPHLELAVVIDYINKNIKQFNLKENCITLVGFSAGGHLAASYSYLYPEFEKRLNLKKDELRPFAQILGYPVASTILETTSRTKANITNECDLNLVQKLSSPENICDNYVPTYIWATKADQCVPYEHSVQLANALKKHNIKYQFDLFEKGIHGGSLCNHAVYNGDFNFDEILENRIWVQNSVEFIYKLIK